MGMIPLICVIAIFLNYTHGNNDTCEEKYNVWYKQYVSSQYRNADTLEVACKCLKSLDKDMVCDGIVDCPLQLDEKECGGCLLKDFACDLRNQSSSSKFQTCYTSFKKYNGVVDCENGSDEQNCTMISMNIDRVRLINMFSWDNPWIKTRLCFIQKTLT